MTKHIKPAFLACAALAACEPPEEAAVIASAAKYSIAAFEPYMIDPPLDLPYGYDCPDWGCGTNAATLGDGIIFDRLEATGAFNEGHVRIVGAILGGTPDPASGKVMGGAVATVTVRGDRLILSDPADYQGTALEGAVLQLEHEDGRTYELLIRRVKNINFWTTFRPHEVNAYDIRFRRTGDPRRVAESLPAARRESLPRDPVPITTSFAFALCKGDHFDTEAVAGPLDYSALVFEGDRYDGAAKTVSGDVGASSVPGPWFNLACAGTVMAKMHLLRHTHAGAGRGEKTIEQRQAMLKMLTADYCGDGRSFTENGTPLFYADGEEWYHPNPGRLLRLEAIWSPEGAVCLNRPRLADLAEVQAHCAAIRRARAHQAVVAWPPPLEVVDRPRQLETPSPPPCPAVSAHDVAAWSALGYVVSAVPGKLLPFR